MACFFCMLLAPVLIDLPSMGFMTYHVLSAFLAFFWDMDFTLDVPQPGFISFESD